MRALIRHVLAATEPPEGVTVQGWVRTRREAKGFSFVEVNDASCLANVQVIVEAGVRGSEHLHELTTGASVSVTGTVVASPAAGAYLDRECSKKLIGCSLGWTGSLGGEVQ